MEDTLHWRKTSKVLLVQLRNSLPNTKKSPKYKEIPLSEYIITLSSVTRDMVPFVEGKNANIGEIKKALPLIYSRGICYNILCL